VPDGRRRSNARRHGRRPDAMPILALCKRLFGRNDADVGSPSSPRLNADRLIEQGNVFEDRGDIPTALDCYRDAVIVAPNYARAHMNVGNAFRKLNLLDEASAATLEAVRSEPAYAPARFNLGVLLATQGDH